MNKKIINTVGFWCFSTLPIYFQMTKIMVSGDLKEKDWLQQTFNSFHPKAKYKIAKWMRLTGIMLIVCVREDQCHAIKNISAQTLGTGGLGFGKILQLEII